MSTVHACAHLSHTNVQARSLAKLHNILPLHYTVWYARALVVSQYDLQRLYRSIEGLPKLLPSAAPVVVNPCYSSPDTTARRPATREREKMQSHSLCGQWEGDRVRGAVVYHMHAAGIHSFTEMVQCQSVASACVFFTKMIQAQGFCSSITKGWGMGEARDKTGFQGPQRGGVQWLIVMTCVLVSLH